MVFLALKWVIFVRACESGNLGLRSRTLSAWYIR